VILPGVAAFGLGMERAERFRGELERVAGDGRPLLGICRGMQLLFEEGEEDGPRRGLGLLPGRVTRIPAGVQVPHIGWQKLEARSDGSLARNGEWAYFAHSYRCETEGELVEASVAHGAVRIAAVVRRSNVFGVQFHPEKSAHDGEGLLRRFLTS
jgi:glutamine amidotransferase